jgi:hypothetical protein
MCSIDGCDAPVHARAFCLRHYRAFKKHGDPLKLRPWCGSIESRFLRYVVKGDGEDDCWAWTGAKSKAGYGRIGIGAPTHRTDGAHRVSWRLHNANAEIPTGMFVLHSCDNPQCTNPKHLRLGTKSDNSNDMYSRNRQGKRKYRIAEDNHKTLLTKEQVLEIRSGGKSDTIWAKELNVTKGCVRHARIGITWKHI